MHLILSKHTCWPPVKKCFIQSFHLEENVVISEESVDFGIENINDSEAPNCEVSK